MPGMNKRDLRIRTARALLWWRSRPGPLARLMAKSSCAAPIPQEGKALRVAAVQVRARLYERAKDFAGHMEELVREASRGGASLVVFPEDHGTQLLGILPGLKHIASETSIAEISGKAEGGVGEILRIISPYAVRIFTKTCAELARAYHVYLVSGSIRRVSEDNRLVNTSYCYDPDGKLLARQDKLHLMATEEEWGHSPGEELAVVQGNGFRLAFPICHDASYYETFRLALAGGADIVAVQAADAAAYREWYARRGIWLRVQETPVYGIASHLVGDFLGLRFTGRSAIYAPLDISPGGDGILAQASSTEMEEIVIADLNLEALSSWRRTNPTVLPVELILRFLPELYQRPRTNAEGVSVAQKKNDGNGERGQEELAAEEDEKLPAAAELMTAREADVEEEHTPSIEDGSE